ncbi:MAG: permease [Elusimicrobia bacterium CG08_land_8_20_14_0_20_51_18]|nr:MAG: permease [Elusimicrobia bacterium CG08_land_8_20_14_0_20_51_18]
MLLKFSEWLVYSVFKMERGEKLAAALDFFVYDSLKILFLLFTFITIIGVFRSYVSGEKIRANLNKSGLAAYFWASLLGAVTPFCSCSSIPLFIGFIKAGIPLGVSFAFLITSPLVNEYLVVLMAGMFGLKITFFYVFNGILLGVFSGFILGKMNLERYIAEDIKDRGENAEAEEKFPDFLSRIKFGVKESSEIIKKLWPWLLASVAIGALIHNYVPEEKIHGLISKTGFFSVPIAVIVGAPLYGNCAAILPIAFVLFQKGIPLGTALSFMMAVSALSLPEAVMLRRVIKLELIAAFFGITASGIIITGYLLNYLQGILK